MILKNVDSIVDNYNTVFTSLLDKHAPLKTDYVVPRDVQPWMTEEIMSARREKRKGERIWRKSRLEVHLQMFIALCLILKNLIHGEKEQFFKKQISDCGGDQKKLFGIVNSLLGRGKKALLPQHDDSLTLARLFNEFFITKIDNIRHEFPNLEQNLPSPSSINFHAMLDVNLESSLTYFKHTNIDEVNVLLSKMNKTTCLFDPFPTRLLLDFSHLFIDVIFCINNLTFSFASFLVAFKSAVVKQLFKKNYT